MNVNYIHFSQYYAREYWYSVPFLANAFNLHNLSSYDWNLVILFDLVTLMISEVNKIFMTVAERY